MGKWTRNRLLVRLILVFALAIAVLSATYVRMQVNNTEKSATFAISDYGRHIAENYVQHIDIALLETFLADPQENDAYWNVRGELDRFRTQIGALYVYIFRIDEDSRAYIMIDGQPPGSDVASPINEETDIEPEDQVRLLAGESAGSEIVEDPLYGVYISSYAPITGSDGTVIAGNDGRMNVTGAMVMTVDGVLLEGNIFAKQSENVNSQGILLFAARNSVVRGNVVSGNRVGIYVEGSTDNRIEGNEITDNFMGIELLDSEGNEIAGNQWIGNVADAGARRSGANRIERNFWDSFSGVDADGDGASDLRYAINPFFLSVTERRPVFQVLFQSPGMKFLEGLYGADRSGWAVDAAPLVSPARETDKTSRESGSGRAAGAAGALLLAAACAVIIISRRRTT